MKEICICAAVKFEGQIIRGHRHANCLQTAKMMGLNTSHVSADEGFITSRNRFVGRKLGYKLQIAAGIKSKDKINPYVLKELYSEDLY